MKLYPVHTWQISGRMTNPAASLRDGQIVYGKVLRFDHRGRAVVELTNTRLLAQIKAPLDTLKTYWFQVQKRDGQLALQVLAAASDGEEDLIRQFGIEPKGHVKQLLSAVKTWQLPVDRATFIKLVGWLGDTADRTAALEVIRFMYEYRLPLTKQVFFSLLPLWQETSLAEQLQDLQIALDKLPGAGAIRHILQMLSGHAGDPVDWTRGNEVYRAFLQILSFLGGPDEREKKAPEKNLYQSLQQLLKEQLPRKVEIRITDVLRHLSASRLLFQERDGFIQGLFILPLSLPERTVDLKLQWTGKRTEEGKLDPDYCRILLMLTMPHLGTTEVAMHVQKRHISLTVRTDFPRLKEVGMALVPDLKEKLAEKEYTLSTVRFEKLSEHTNSSLGPEGFIKQNGRLDVRI